MLFSVYQSERTDDKKYKFISLVPWEYKMLTFSDVTQDSS